MKSKSDKNIKGIDVSSWQKNVDYSKVKDSGIEVVIIKATEGIDYIDKSMEEHYVNAKKAHMKIGFYHFFSDKTDPKAQADDFYNAIKDKKFDLYPVLDIENDSQGRNSTEITTRCIDFLNEFKKISGYDCVVYTYTSFAKGKLDSRLKKYPLWIAHYGVNEPADNGIWADWVGFQFTDKGAVNGVNGNCDLNEFTEAILIQRVNTSNSQVQLWKISISGEIVKDLQIDLNYNFNCKLSVDGYFGEDTLKGCPIIKIGTRGDIVKIIQRRLVYFAYTHMPSGVDGIFLDETLKAIKDFQKKKGLVVDGIVGANTWKALFKK